MDKIEMTKAVTDGWVDKGSRTRMRWWLRQGDGRGRTEEVCLWGRKEEEVKILSVWKTFCGRFTAETRFSMGPLCCCEQWARSGVGC